MAWLTGMSICEKTLKSFRKATLQICTLDYENFNLVVIGHLLSWFGLTEKFTQTFYVSPHVIQDACTTLSSVEHRKRYLKNVFVVSIQWKSMGADV